MNKQVPLLEIPKTLAPNKEDTDSKRDRDQQGESPLTPRNKSFPSSTETAKFKSHSDSSMKTVGQNLERRKSTSSIESTGTIKSPEEKSSDQQPSLAAVIAETITEIASEDNDSDEYEVREAYGAVDAVVPRRSLQYTHATYTLHSSNDGSESSIRRKSSIASSMAFSAKESLCTGKRESFSLTSNAASISGISARRSMDFQDSTDFGLKRFRHSVFPLKSTNPQSNLDENTLENSDDKIELDNWLGKSSEGKFLDFNPLDFTSDNQQAQPKLPEKDHESAIVVVIPKEGLANPKTKNRRTSKKHFNYIVGTLAILIVIAILILIILYVIEPT